jgi:hypothetical protein
MQQLGRIEMEEWKSGLNEFLRRLAFHYSKRIVLKSPTHTGRIELLAQMFPNAKFIHIVRNPYDIVPSTLRLWRSLDDVQGLQIPKHENLEDYVHRAYERMYGGFHKYRAQLGKDRIIDIQYESLVDDTCRVVEQVYAQLELGDFEMVREKLEETVDAKKGYQKNTHVLDADLVSNINQHWHDYFRRYDYEICEQ